jgi:hypothetical protein
MLTWVADLSRVFRQCQHWTYFNGFFLVKVIPISRAQIMFTLVPNVLSWFQAFSWVQGLLDEVFRISSAAIEFVPIWIRYL